MPNLTVTDRTLWPGWSEIWRKRRQKILTKILHSWLLVQEKLRTHAFFNEAHFGGMKKNEKQIAVRHRSTKTTEYLFKCQLAIYLVTSLSYKQQMLRLRPQHFYQVQMAEYLYKQLKQAMVELQSHFIQLLQ